MPLNEPAWWYDEPGAMAAKALAPIGHLYDLATQRRLRNATPYRAALPVICIGNFTAGGTGKTPLALLTARLLTELGRRPGFLTRGHGGAARQPHWVDTARDTAALTGDEPLLLAASAPVMIARDRAAGARAIMQSRRPVDVIVMDDGLQNPGLVKDLSIALVDGQRGIGNGRVIPAGPLRAALEFQLTLADAIVVNGGTGNFPGSQRIAGHFDKPVLRAAIVATGDTAWLRDRAVFAFAGIGNPRRFFDTLEQCGARVMARKCFADHQPLTETMAKALLTEAARQDAILVTTQKDWVRLAPASPALAELQRTARPLAVGMSLDEADREQLIALIRTALDGVPLPHATMI